MVMAIATVALMLAVPVTMIATDTDAQGDWWGNTTDIYVKAGSTFKYGDIQSPDGKAIQRIEASGALQEYFMVSGHTVTANIPSATIPGEYDMAIVIYTSGETYWMRFIFHVTEADAIPSGYAAYAPVINTVDVSHVGNNTKLASIKLNTTNVATLHVDYADGVQTENIDVTSDSLMLTHKFDQKGLFAMKITASNGYGTTQSVIVYDAGLGEAVNYTIVQDGDSHPLWILYALVIGAILCAVGFYVTRIPQLVIAAIVLGIMAAVDYFWIL